MVFSFFKNLGTAAQGVKALFTVAAGTAVVGSGAYMYRKEIGKAASDVGAKLADDPFGTIGNAFTSTKDAIANYGDKLDATKRGIDQTVALGQEIKNDPGKAFSTAVGKVTGSDPSKPEEDGGFGLGSILKWAGIGGGALLGGNMLKDWLFGGGDNGKDNENKGGFNIMNLLMVGAVVGLVVANWKSISGFVSDTFNKFTGKPDANAPSVAQNIGMDPTGRTQVAPALTYEPAPAY